jgi:predicted metal-dependent hydrolase
MPPTKTRSPQLSLRLDAEAPDSAGRWHEGARLPFLGGHLVLKLDTDRKLAVRENEILHLPMPPAATKRQIQDGAEAWLRQEAALIIGASVGRQAAHGAVPRWTLSFAARGGWLQMHSDGMLRFNWRLIEQPAAVIEKVVAGAIAALPRPGSSADLWDLSPA